MSLLKDRHLICFAPEGNAGGGTGDGQGGGSGDGQGGQGGAATTWIDSLPDEVKTSIPEEYRKDPNFIKYKDAGEFFKGHKNLAETVGKKGVIIPDEKATPEEIESFQKALGRPDKADGYKLSDVKDLHPSLKPTPESSKAFFEAAHKMGFSNKQADSLNGWYLSTISKAISEQEKSFEDSKLKSTNELRQEWGKDYDGNLNLAKTFVEKIGGSQALDAFGDLGNNPAVLKVLAVAGKAFSEDSFGKFGQKASSSDAQTTIDSIMADGKDKREHPYWNEKHADHYKWVGINGELQKLYKQVEGNKNQ